MLLHRGSTGTDVGLLQNHLRELGFYAGAVNNIYDDTVEASVRAFQQSRKLTADGIVGDRTWALLFPGQLAATPLAQRCLALTGSFETSTCGDACFSGLTGDFDGQGLSFGALQWNLGQGTLQPLLSEMLVAHEDIMSSLFGDHLNALQEMLTSTRAQQLTWSQGIQNTVRSTISDPWKSMLCALGATAEFQAIQVTHAAAIQRTALAECAKFGVNTERALALMFDIGVQNGSIGAATEALIRADFAAMPAESDPMLLEVAKLRSIANRRAEASNPKFVEDVRARKLVIANGEGTVHGQAWNLEEQFGIRLSPLLAD